MYAYALKYFDVPILPVINGFCGQSWLLDRIIGHLALEFKWAVPLCVVGVPWFQRSENQLVRRKIILATMLARAAGDLTEPIAGYRGLFKICTEMLTLANVKDAFLLRDGGIGVLTKQNSVTATAETLSQFCQRFPKSTLRLITPREYKQRPTIGLIVTTFHRRDLVRGDPRNDLTPVRPRRTHSDCAMSTICAGGTALSVAPSLATNTRRSASCSIGLCSTGMCLNRSSILSAL
jgi:hypothetical protein